MDIFGRISVVFLMVISGVLCKKCFKDDPIEKYVTTNISLTEFTGKWIETHSNLNISVSTLEITEKNKTMRFNWKWQPSNSTDELVLNGRLNITKSSPHETKYVQLWFSVDYEFSQQSTVFKFYLAGLKAGSVLVLSRCEEPNNGAPLLHVFSKNVKIDEAVANEILEGFSKNITSLQVVKPIKKDSHPKIPKSSKCSTMSLMSVSSIIALSLIFTL